MHRSTAHWELATPEDTLALGRALGMSLVGGDVVGLVGPLGAGKTHLVKGVANGNATSTSHPTVSSPTFTLVHEYRGRLALYHIDAYRLQSPNELAALGFDEFCRPDSAVLVEWADRVQTILPEDRLTLTVTPTGETSRVIEAEAQGSIAHQCLLNLCEEATKQ